MGKKKPHSPDGRNTQTRQKKYNQGWEDLGWKPEDPPTFTNTASFRLGDTFGEWVWEPTIGWVHADDWETVQSKLDLKTKKK